MQQNVVSFEELFGRAKHSAVHLEMRDSYAVSGEAADVARWKETGEVNADPNSDYWRTWVVAVSGAVERGVRVRRARIVSQPVADYIRFEYAITPVNLAAGEEVRWLVRRNASDIALPGNDFWLFDGTFVRLNHFTGNGDGADEPFEDTEDPGLAQLCATAFEAVWERATPHAEFAL